MMIINYFRNLKKELLNVYLQHGKQDKDLKRIMRVLDNVIKSKLQRTVNDEFERNK